MVAFISVFDVFLSSLVRGQLSDDNAGSQTEKDVDIRLRVGRERERRGGGLGQRALNAVQEKKDQWVRDFQ